MDLTFANKAWPALVFPPTGQNPLTPNAFLACLVALDQANIFLPPLLDFARKDLFLLTTLPALFNTKSAFLRPPVVFTRAPEKTCHFFPEIIGRLAIIILRDIMVDIIDAFIIIILAMVMRSSFN